MCRRVTSSSISRACARRNRASPPYGRRHAARGADDTRKLSPAARAGSSSRRRRASRCSQRIGARLRLPPFSQSMIISSPCADRRSPSMDDESASKRPEATLPGVRRSAHLYVDVGFIRAGRAGRPWSATPVMRRASPRPGSEPRATPRAAAKPTPSRRRAQVATGEMDVGVKGELPVVVPRSARDSGSPRRLARLEAEAFRIDAA